MKVPTLYIVVLNKCIKEKKTRERGYLGESKLCSETVSAGEEACTRVTPVCGADSRSLQHHKFKLSTLFF